MAKDNKSTPSDQNEALPESRQKRNVPKADIDFGNVCTLVCTKWGSTPWLTMQWLTVESFSANVKEYNSLLTQKTRQGSSRPKITGILKQLDGQIDDSIEYIKGYLADKYGKKHAADYYPAFGIIRKGKLFVIPKDRNNRKDALVQMLAGLEQEGFGDKTYGKAYWQEIKTKFDDHLQQATQTDSGVSEKTGNKNVLKKSMKKALNSIILVLKGNYPDTWKTELRNWGFQKEKY